MELLGQEGATRPFGRAARACGDYRVRPVPEREAGDAVGQARALDVLGVMRAEHERSQLVHVGAVPSGLVIEALVRLAVQERHREREPGLAIGRRDQIPAALRP